MLALPEGYKVGPTALRQMDVYNNMLCDEWEVVVYHRGYAAFLITRRFTADSFSPKYAARFHNGKMQEFKTIPEMIQVMCTKHKLGVTE